MNKNNISQVKSNQVKSSQIKSNQIVYTHIKTETDNEDNDYSIVIIISYDVICVLICDVTHSAVD